jgi:protein SPA2
VTSDRSAGGRMSGRVSVGGGGGGSEDSERIRRDYEFKIATMQTRITGLERDLESAQMREQDRSNGDDRVRMLETELEELRRVSEHLPELGCTQLKGV